MGLAGCLARNPVSIHAPARGATLSSALESSIRRSFNPRAREGRDLRPALPQNRSCVSIHAPARGATSCMTRSGNFAWFQSTRPRGARPRLLVLLSSMPAFQSTRPRGARHEQVAACGHADGVSIHAPARGATSCPNCRGPRTASFNPRAREGRDTISAICPP